MTTNVPRYIPKNLNLAEQKPKAVYSYIRRFRNIQQGNTNVSTEGQEIIIPIDTSTPSAFLDTQMSYLQADVVITNKNPYIDYIDFGPAGTLSLFEEAQCRNNGLAIESIYDFNTVNENFMGMEGLGQTYLKLYHERLNQSDVSECTSQGNHLNSCKPPMVDYCGRIMGFCNAATGGTYSATDAPGSQSIQQNTNSCVSHGSTCGGSTTTSPWAVGYVDGSTAYTNAMTNQWTNAMTNIIVKPGVYAQGMGTGNINFWPQMIGVDEYTSREVMEKTPLRFQDYMTYLCHVRNIPIGCTTRVPCSPTTGYTIPNTEIVGDLAFNDGVFEATVTMPLLMGTIGILNPKMVPTMLLDNLQLVLTLTNSGKALKVSMDPCRRIPGTHRDFFTYYGNSLGDVSAIVTANTAPNTLLPKVLNGQITLLESVNTYAAGPPIAVTSVSQYEYLKVCTNPLTGQAADANLFANTNYRTKYFPSGGLVPQYFQAQECASDTAVPSTFRGYNLTLGNDAMGCYGTKLRSSTAQTSRCIRNGLTQPAGVPRQYENTNQGVAAAMPKISVKNIVFVAQQVLVTEEVTAEIITSSMRADISVLTSTIQVYRSIQVTPSESQNIIIPAKCGMANSLFCLFRSGTQTNGGSTKQYLVNSLSGVCPFGSAKFTQDTTSFVGTTLAPTISYVKTAAGSGISAQLSIGADLVPMQAMTSINEIVAELEKCQHGLFTRYNNMSFGNPIVFQPEDRTTLTSGATSIPVYDIFTDGGFCTTWLDPYFLDDQTIVNNALWPLLMGSQEANLGWRPVNVGSYKLPMFKHPDSKFILGFDLDTWSAVSDVVSSGRYLGNNTTSVRLEGCKLFAAAYPNETFTCTALVFCEMRWSFQAGGTSQTFT